jgi:hypothetical protein
VALVLDAELVGLPAHHDTRRGCSQTVVSELAGGMPGCGFPPQISSGWLSKA